MKIRCDGCQALFEPTTPNVVGGSIIVLDLDLFFCTPLCLLRVIARGARLADGREIQVIFGLTPAEFIAEARTGTLKAMRGRWDEYLALLAQTDIDDNG